MRELKRITVGKLSGIIIEYEKSESSMRAMWRIAGGSKAWFQDFDSSDISGITGAMILPQYFEDVDRCAAIIPKTVAPLRCEEIELRHLMGTADFMIMVSGDSSDAHLRKGTIRHELCHVLFRTDDSWKHRCLDIWGMMINEPAYAHLACRVFAHIEQMGCYIVDDFEEVANEAVAIMVADHENFGPEIASLVADLESLIEKL